MKKFKIIYNKPYMAKNKPNKTIRFVFRTQSNIYDAYFAKIGNVFHKNAPS